MRNRRDSGRTRLKNGLAKAGHPLPKEFSSQGSYAMRTMVQDDACDYDIDDGVYFDKEDLKDAHGNYLGAREARTRVRNALKDDRLAYDAVVKTNCGSVANRVELSIMPPEAPATGSGAGA